MVQSLQGGSGREKVVGASRLTPQACSFYAGVNAAGAWATSRPVGLSDDAGVEVRLDLKNGRGSSAAVLAPQGRYVQKPDYLAAVVESEHRYDLHGQPAGIVSDKERTYSREKLQRLRAKSPAREAHDAKAE